MDRWTFSKDIYIAESLLSYLLPEQAKQLQKGFDFVWKAEIHIITEL